MKKLSAVLLFSFCFATMLFAQDIFTLALIGTPETIQAAINAGAKLDDRNENDLTPLMCAAAGNQNPDVITTLLRAGAKLDDRDKNGTTPLMWAAIANQNPDMITTLLRAGAKLDDRNIVGWTPLMCAAIFNKNPDIITTLLKAGAKIDERSNIGMTPLMNAAEQNENPDVVMTLLNAGADPTIKSYEGKTALDYAQGNAKLKGTSALKALQDATLGSSGSTNKTVAKDIFTLAEGGTPERIQAAINAGAKLDDREGILGMTPLMHAAKFNKNPDVITTLLKAGAKIDERDKYGETPLMYAAEHQENPDVISTLLNAGAKIDERDDSGRTPLIYAAWFNKNPDMITTLLKTGAKIDERDNRGETPLMYAAKQNENPDVVMTLLNAGADPTIKSKEGKTALDYAQSNAKLKGTPAFEALRSATYGSANKTTTQTISTDWVSTPSGSYRVERLWQEGSFTYALVSYRNTTSRTFKDTITITALFYDTNNRMLDMEDKSLYASENGPMAPSFESTVKIMSTCTGAKRVEVRISGY